MSALGVSRRRLGARRARLCATRALAKLSLDVRRRVRVRDASGADHVLARDASGTGRVPTRPNVAGGAGRPGRLVDGAPSRRARRRGESARGHVQRGERLGVSFGSLRASALAQARRRHGGRFLRLRRALVHREMRHRSRGRRGRGGARPRPRARRRRLRRPASAGGRRLTRHVPPVVRAGDAPGRRARRRRGGVFARGPTAERGAPRIRAVLPRRRRRCRGGPREPRREDVHPIPLRAPTRPLRRHTRRPERRAPRECARLS